MNPPPVAPKIHLSSTTDYRENYANSVQVRVSLWDFFLSFGTINQTTPDAVAIHNFQGIFLSPQQAKALTNVLAQNVQQYDQTGAEPRRSHDSIGDQFRKIADVSKNLVRWKTCDESHETGRH